MRLFVVAGESSGDKLAANLVARLKAETAVDLTGVGGPALITEGMRSLFPMSDLAVMGWRDVYMRLPLLLWRLKQVVDEIVRTRPDMVFLVDSQEFSQRVAAGVRKKCPDIPIVLYVAPSVWAWRPERAKAIKPLYNEILSVLPFEPEAFAALGGPKCTYVGHSGEDLARLAAIKPEEREQLLLLPGSRKGEIDRNLSSLTEVVAKLGAGTFERNQLITVDHLVSALRQKDRLKDAAIDVQSGREAFEQALQRASLALAVSGTVTLELAFADVPHIIYYVADKKLGQHYEAAGKPLVGLPNILLKRELVPEIIGTAPRTHDLFEAAQDLLANPKHIEDQREGFAEIRQLMQEGAPEAPRQDPVERILSYR